MTPAAIASFFELLKGVLTFPQTILEFIRILAKTPEDKHQALLDKVNKEAQAFQDTGRPSWN